MEKITIFKKKNLMSFSVSFSLYYDFKYEHDKEINKNVQCISLYFVFHALVNLVLHRFPKHVFSLQTQKFEASFPDLSRVLKKLIV